MAPKRKQKPKPEKSTGSASMKSRGYHPVMANFTDADYEAIAQVAAKTGAKVSAWVVAVAAQEAHKQIKDAK